MNMDMHPASDQYVGIIGENLVCHTGVIQFPMRKGWKRVHRLVVLPDYQGIGIGTAFINEIARRYHDDGYVFNLTTTTPSLAPALCRDKRWRLNRYGRAINGYSGFKRYGDKYGHLNNARSDHRITYSFEYIGDVSHEQ